jgi:[acyl-carrier-protein] S-malonyltransferase
MQKAVPVGVGAMAALLGLDYDAAVAAAREAAQGQVCDPANDNGGGQVVVSGNKEAVDRAVEIAKAKGAKRAMLLPVSAPFHCSLMKPAAERLRERLAAVPLQAPAVPVINNIDVAAPDDPAAIRDALYRQAFGPVRWVELTQALRARGLQHVVECGPGKVLSGMVKRIDAELVSGAVLDPASLKATQELLA